MSSAANAAETLRFVAFQVVASTPAGAPVYSIADVIEPLPPWNARIFRAARKTAGARGYVLVGRARACSWADFEASARRVSGVY